MIVHDGSMLIKDEIKLKVRSKIKEIEADTEAKIGKMNDETDSQVKIIKDRILKDAKKRAEAETKKINAQANVEINRMMLDAREELIDESISYAMKELGNADAKSFRRELLLLLRRGVDECRGDKLAIIANRETCNVFDSRTLDDVAKESGRRIKFVKDARKMPFGIILYDTANNMFLDYSFESVFKIKEDRMRSGVSKILFN
ncbi:MAG: V-type ATP synthase subunit E family protein [archaeon]|nr:V-type ATP synthase subunit E family protein [archaeon]